MEKYVLTCVRWARCGYIVYCFFVSLGVCTVEDFAADDKASGVKFCTVVHLRPVQEISHCGELLLPQKPKIGRIGQRAWPMRWPIRPARWPRVGSACVDIRSF